MIIYKLFLKSNNKQVAQSTSPDAIAMLLLLFEGEVYLQTEEVG